MKAENMIKIEKINNLINDIKLRYKEARKEELIKTLSREPSKIKNFYKIIIGLLKNFGEDEFIFYPLLTSENEMVFPICKYILVDEIVKIEFKKYITLDIITGNILREHIVQYGNIYDLTEYEIANDNFFYEFNEIRNKVINNNKKFDLILEYYKELSDLFGSNEIFRDLLIDKNIEKDIRIINRFGEWVPTKGLNLINDDILKLATDLENNFNFRYSFTKSSTGEKIVEIFSEVSLCNLCKNDNQDGFDKLINEFNIQDENLQRISLKLKRDVDRGIGECTESCISKCPLVIAGYLKYLKDTNTLELKLKEREFYRKKQKINNYFDFFWDPDEGLKNIPQDEFNLAYSLVNKGLIKVDPFLTDGKITMRDFPLCSNLSKLDNYSQSESKLSRSINSINVCGDRKCNRRTCIVSVAGYIYYLIKSGNKDKIKEDRKYYKENEDSILAQYNEEKPKFNFTYEVSNGLDDFPDNQLEITEQLLEASLFQLDDNLDSKGFLNTMAPKKWCSASSTDKIERFNFNPQVKPSILCNNPRCNYGFCPVRLANYIYYLKNIGKYTEYKEQRRKAREGIYEILDDYEASIPNIKKVLNSLYNVEEKSLYCIVEGERGVGKTELVQKIVSILYKNGKITTPDYEPILFQNLMSQIAHGFSFTSSREIIEKRKQKNNLRDIDLTCDGKMEYFELEDNRVYVLTGLEEFIKDFKTYGKKYNNEIRQKQIKHLLDNLGTISGNKYIIIVGETKNIEELFNIDNRIKFIFRESRIVFPPISLENIFIEYSKHLNEKNSASLLCREKEFKDEFFDFISLNKSYLPFGNYGLARYLANYSNVKGELVLPENIYKKESIDEKLANIVGLENVKVKVKEFEKYMIFNKKAQANGLTLNSNNMHMIFTGNPGTGKTTIARIMAKMLFDLGIIKEDKLIEVERKDLIAGFIGQTAPKTSEVIERARGGVLFIDEAYSLVNRGQSSDNFGSEAITTLIKAMEDHKDELVVIFAGYKDEMKTFIDSNPGIASRIGYTFDFEDYNAEALYEIYKRKAENMGFDLDEDIKSSLFNIFNYFAKRKNFGNGRFVDKVLQETIMNHSHNYINEHITLLTSQDVPSIEELNGYDKIDTNLIEKDLEDVVGLRSIKEKIKELQNYVIFTQKAQNHQLFIPVNNTHMIFAGNAGTGKTTVARIVAKMLFNIGVLHENKVVEVERKDLVAGYVGQTAPKTNEVIERALGGVLFIDEAYTLTPTNAQDFGGEAIATLIKAMEDHKGEFVVIFAGYKDEMQDFIESNAGIASRIGYTFEFEDYSADELVKIFEIKMKRYGFSIEENVSAKVKSVMQYFCGVEDFGNGRFVDRVVQETLLKHSKNLIEEKIDVITKEDIPEVKEIINILSNSGNMINPEDITEEAIRKTAIHEVGHAMVAYLLSDTLDIEKITINPEGTGALGYVRFKGTANKFTQSKLELENKIKKLLAGGCAEEVFVGYNENGNSNDLEKATLIAKRMVTKFGMSDLGLARIENLSDGMGKVVYEEINKILDKCHKETIELIKQNKDKMEKVVTYLLEHKEITEEEFLNCVKQN